MKIIDGIAHVARTFENADSFYLEVNAKIWEMQKVGLEVEVQYQQSDCVVSALVLGRKDKAEEGFTNDR